MSTFSGEPSFGVGDGFGVGVSVEGGDELGHLFVALDAAEGSFGVEHAGPRSSAAPFGRRATG